MVSPKVTQELHENEHDLHGNSYKLDPFRGGGHLPPFLPENAGNVKAAFRRRQVRNSAGFASEGAPLGPRTK